MRFSNLSQWFVENLFNMKSNANERAVLRTFDFRNSKRAVMVERARNFPPPVPRDRSGCLAGQRVRDRVRQCALYSLSRERTISRIAGKRNRARFALPERTLCANTTNGISYCHERALPGARRPQSDASTQCARHRREV